MSLDELEVMPYRLKVNHVTLGTAIFDEFREKFGEKIILDVNSQKFVDEYDITIKVNPKTNEIRDFSHQLEDKLQAKGINVIIVTEEVKPTP